MTDKTPGRKIAKSGDKLHRSSAGKAVSRSAESGAVFGKAIRSRAGKALFRDPASGAFVKTGDRRTSNPAPRRATRFPTRDAAVKSRVPAITVAPAGTNDAAYQRVIRLDIREVARRLNAALGGTLVAALAGSKDLKASHKWAKEGGPQPRPEATKRLNFAYEQWQKVVEVEGEQVARVWFIGANPWLDYDTPTNAIREDRLKEVARAAQALIDDSFSG